LAVIWRLQITHRRGGSRMPSTAHACEQYLRSDRVTALLQLGNAHRMTPESGSPSPFLPAFGRQPNGSEISLGR
jgi:hypothetical protein